MNGRTNSNPGTTVIDATKSPFATLPPNNINSLRGNQKIDLSWVNPVTEVATPGGYVVAKRAYTSVIRNEDHFPTSLSDGIEIYRDTNQTDGSAGVYNDTNLTNGKNYYYGLISVTDNDIPSEVATTQNVPSGGIHYGGKLDPLANEDFWNGYSWVAGATANNTALIYLSKLSGGGIDENVNVFNSALARSVSQYTGFSNSTLGDYVGTSPGQYALFCGGSGVYSNSNWRYSQVLVAYDENCTLMTSVNNTNTSGGLDIVGCTFNNGGLYAGGRNSTNSSFLRTVWFINANLSASNINLSIEPRRAGGVTQIGNIAAIAPGYADTIYDGNEAGKEMNIITTSLTLLQTISVAEVESDNMLFSSTADNIIYAPDTSDRNIYTYNENLTESIIGQLPSDLNETYICKSSKFDEYSMSLTGDRHVIAYDRFLTMSRPTTLSDYSDTTTSMTTINNHILVVTALNSNMEPEVYSI